MRESAVQKKLINFIEKNGGYVVKVVGASKGGVPDLLVCYKGKFIGIEVKMPNTKHTLTKLQAVNLSKIQKAGGLSFVITSLDELKEVLCKI